MDNRGGTIANSGHLKLTFGKPMRAHFLFDEDFVNLNHGMLNLARVQY